MKVGIIAIVITLAVTGCKKQAASTIPLHEQPDSSVLVLPGSGNFRNEPYGIVSGEAKIYRSGLKY